MEWISVKDRLPKETGQYLCCEYVRGWEHTIRTFLKPHKCFTYIGKDYSREIANNVTHWMELPKLPKRNV